MCKLTGEMKIQQHRDKLEHMSKNHHLHAMYRKVKEITNKRDICKNTACINFKKGNIIFGEVDIKTMRSKYVQNDEID